MHHFVILNITVYISSALLVDVCVYVDVSVYVCLSAFSQAKSP